jgi:hypothetical protein
MKSNSKIYKLKRLGKMKDELAGIISREFVVIKSII